MKISIFEKEMFSVIQPKEEILLYNREEFKKYIERALDTNHSHVIIDLANVRFADSALIAALIFASKKAQLLEKKCFLINVTNDVRKILQISNIESMFNICNNERECFQYIESQSPNC
ncbi:MAG: STAS domain-containing protein [Spirochaetes bacterium]|nr:STAS domain-containing protein [Spirochaetota bacterium]